MWYWTKRLLWLNNNEGEMDTEGEIYWSFCLNDIRLSNVIFGKLILKNQLYKTFIVIYYYIVLITTINIGLLFHPFKYLAMPYF